MKHNQLRITFALCLFAALNLPAAVRYVDLNSASPTSPYTNWSTAATNIQDAVDAAVAGDQILVTNGVYQTGGNVLFDALTNRVAVDKSVAIQSVNGPEFTFIQGYQVPGTTNGESAIRCVYLAFGASLSGFTLTQGATRTAGDSYERSGGGVLCDSASVVVSNCVITGNAASSLGGGAYSGTLKNCTLTGNSAGGGGGASTCILVNCTLSGNSAVSGGGSSGGTLNNCTLTGNSAGDSGGGANGGTLNDCVLTGNSAVSSGGGAVSGVLSNCTLIGNSAGSGGGAAGGTLNNCVISSNSATATFGNGGGVSGGTLKNCALRGNTASGFGGGAYSGALNNCTVTGNSAGSGGGVAGGPYGSCALTNCIVFYNQARRIGDNFDDTSTLNFCCTTPLPFSGTGNLTAEPQLAGNWHLNPDSPCRGAGASASVTGLDLDGEAWSNPPSIGCDDYHSGSITGAMTVASFASYTSVATGFAVDFRELISGRVAASRWEFGDGTVVSNRPYASHTWNAAADYLVVLRAYNGSYPGGISATVAVHVVSQPVHYVSLESAAPSPPYSSWPTAATNIQDAVDVATVPGALVWVSNGVYQAGATDLYGLSNRVAVTKPLRVESVNGPGVTAIVGSVPPAPDVVRCVYLAGGAILSGFTLTNGGALQSGTSDDRQRSGGGIYCEWPSAVVSNCVVAGGRASSGGGAAGGTLINCTLIGNAVGVYQAGGGAFGSRLSHCTLTGNRASWGGGASECVLDHCLLIGNKGEDFIFVFGFLPFAGYGGGADRSTLDHCVLTGNSASAGGGVAYSKLGNCTLADNTATGGAYNGLAGGGGAIVSTLLGCTLVGNSTPDYSGGGGANSCNLKNCVVYFNSAPQGSNYAGGFFAISSLDYCCTTPMPTNGLGNITNAPLFLNLAGGNLHLQPNSPCIDAGTNLSGIITDDLDGRPRPLDGNADGVAAFDIGAYEHLVLFVGQDSPSPAPPYNSWVTAATNIQDAADLTLSGAGDHVLVTNGVYQYGGRAAGRAVVDKASTKIQSINGPQFTMINGGGAIRCVYLANGTFMTGFTLTNGHAFDSGGGLAFGGLPSDAIISNCVITGCSAQVGGGAGSALGFGGPPGLNGGTLINCTLNGNRATGNPVLSFVPGSGGGADGCKLINCTLTGNLASGPQSGQGGGASSSILQNCILTGNLVPGGPGGGAAYSDLINCTLVTNSASFAGGAYSCYLRNSIVYYNSEPNHVADFDVRYSCTTPLANGVGNITNAPLFVDQAAGNLRLQSNSPCINAGDNASAVGSTDLDGRPRIVGGTVEMGAYEFQPSISGLFLGWLQQYGLPTDGSADSSDSDSDRLNNWQEWIAGTLPTDASSVLRLLNPSNAVSGITVTWQSVSNRTYFLERATNLGAQPPFSLLTSNIVGQPGTTSYTDTNATGTGPFFYRVGVQ